MPNSSALLRTIAVVGDATSVFWLLFGEHKLAGPGFAHRGFPTYLRDYMANRAVSFYRPVLAGLMLPTPSFSDGLSGSSNSGSEFLFSSGYSCAPPAYSVFSFLLNMRLASRWAPGHAVPVWRCFGAGLDRLPRLLLPIVVFAADAGRVWGLDRRRA